MNSKNLVVTVESENLICDLTLNSLECYCKKIGVELDIIKAEKVTSQVYLMLQNYLLKYERVLFISPSVLIRQDSPNLFEIVPEDSLGMFNEGRYLPRDYIFKNAMTYYNERLVKDWEGKYFNCDIILFSKQHRELFKKPSYDLLPEFAPYFNLKIHNSETKMFHLPYHYNRMEFLDSQIGISRLDSYFINYFDAPADIIRGIVEKDIKQWSVDAPNYEYKRNILIRLSAGLGDQIESEPVARFVRKIYPDANMYLTTHHPRAFQHLEKENIKVFDYTNWTGLTEALLVMENNPTEGKSINRLTQVLFHPTDFSSISMVRRTIPHEEKQIKIANDANDVGSVLNLLKDQNQEKPIVVVHAGKWWPSKTFPKPWWQKVVDLLSEKLSVVLIGKTLSEKQGYLDIDCPEDGFDFRDFTGLGENIALISLAKVTVSNDSSPIHIAGAFDNWIVLVPTSKHPNHVIPWRKGCQTYKTKTLYKKLLIDDLEVRHTEFYFDTINMLPKGKTIEEYLPEPEDVVSEIFDIYFNKP